jgi:WD40 repeat protein
VLSAAFSPSGDRIVVAAKDGTGRVWELNSQQSEELKGRNDVEFR